MRYLEINTAGRIVNIVEWDGVSPYAPDGITLVPHAEHPETAIGWTLINGIWTAPAPEPIFVEDHVVGLSPALMGVTSEQAISLSEDE